MADADEDAMLRVGTRTQNDAASGMQQDISDETQDFRFLNALTAFPDPNQATLPKRGEKDFEPNPTELQSNVLAASRQAMHNALSFPRLHNEKTVVTGVFCPTGVLIPREKLAELQGEDEGTTHPDEGVAKRKPSPSYGINPEACVCVPSPRGQHFKNMGRADSINRIWLLPEEALYLIERGSLDVRWPASDPVSMTVTMPDGRQQTINGSVEAGDGSGGVPMSLQAAYAMMLGRAGLNKERYTVYTGLRRGGYTVMRAGSWYGEDNESDFEGVKGQEREYLQEIATRMKEKEQKARSEMGVCDGLRRMFTKIIRSVTGHDDTTKPSTSKQTTCWTSRGPLIGLGLYRDYPSIFRALSLIPTPTINKPTPPTPAALPPVQQPYTIHFHVYKPSTPYRKSAPPPPDFRLCVINARKETCIPSLAALDGLLARTSLDPPRGERMERLMYLRLRQGMRNVILAVVDQGVVSFLRVADAGFAGERLWATRVVGGQGKGGGRGRGGGRGGRGGGRGGRGGGGRGGR